MNYTYDNKSLIRTAGDGSATCWFPVMGEMHYSRCPDRDWKRELLKMKAGGVDIVSAYAIWIHHEEVEGEWDFSGWRNLRAFVERVGECGLTMILRIGPWCHGEVRNGGFPDWLLRKCPRNRCDDPAYLAEVQAFYAKLAEQVRGLLLKDGGPIIGVQIENEYGHCGGLSGPEGEAHMKTLTRLAHEAGFDVPLYTATGWGGAVTAGLLPVMGGYCEAPWDQRITEIEPSGNYLFTRERNDHAIGCDFGLGEGITFDMNAFPYLTAELGGGLQVTYKRRPVARSADIAAMSLAKLGSGCKLLGYYMYHGGMNPDGRLTTLEENKASGSLNDLPVKNYDFRAPLGEYGSMNGAYKEIRMLSLFLREWGSQLCGMDAHIPADAPAHPEDYASLRISWLYSTEAAGNAGTTGRTDAAGGDGSAGPADTPGFLFVNNFQRRRSMAGHDGVALEIPAELGGGRLPELDVYDGDFYFLPVHMRLGGTVLQASACTPLTCLHGRDGETYVFYTAARLARLSRGDRLYTASRVCELKDADGRLYRFDRQPAAGKGDCCGGTRIATLSREDALNAVKLTLGGTDYLCISDALIFADGESVCAESFDRVTFKTWPRLPQTPEGFSERALGTSGFWLYEQEADFPPVRTALMVSDEAEPAGETSAGTAAGRNTRRWSMTVEAWDGEGWDELFLQVCYTGNCARLYEDGRLLDDHIYTGPDCVWEVGLSRFGKGRHKLVLEVDALGESDEIFLEAWPSFNGENRLARLDSVHLKGRLLTRILQA